MFSPPFSKIVAALCDGDDDARHVVVDVIVFSLFKYSISSGYRKIPTEVLCCKTAFPLDLNFFKLEYNFSLLQNLEDSQDTEDFWMWWEEEEGKEEETDDDGRKVANVLLQEARRLAMTDADKKNLCAVCYIRRRVWKVKKKTQGSIQGYGREGKWESENGRARKVRVHVYACTEDSFRRVATDGEQAMEQMPKKHTISFAKTKRGFFWPVLAARDLLILFIFWSFMFSSFLTKCFANSTNEKPSFA